MSNLCYLGIRKNDKTQTEEIFGLLPEDRRRHLYILGKTGMGKSTLLQNLILQDIFAGRGVCFLDPHGDSVDYILDRIPRHRHEDLIYLNPADVDYPIGLNIFQAQKEEEEFLIAGGLMSVFKHIWAGMWSSRMEYILNNTLLTLLEYPDTTLLGVVKIFSDESYRHTLVQKLKNPMVKNFWQNEFEVFHDRYRQEAVAPILNKIGQFLSTSLMRNILGQKKSSFNFREVIDKQQILLINLSKGKLGSDNANLLGSLLVAQIQLATMSRVDLPEEQRTDFYLYVDEFQNFTTESFSEILSESRKYGLNLTLAHQYIDQLSEVGNSKIKSSIFGNIGNMVIFQIGAKDAEQLASELIPITKRQLVSLQKTEIAVKMSVNNQNQEPFLARTMPSIFSKLGTGNKAKLISLSRQKYGRNRKEVEMEIEDYLLSNSESNLTSKIKNRSFTSKKAKS